MYAIIKMSGEILWVEKIFIVYVILQDSCFINYHDSSMVIMKELFYRNK